MRLFFLSLLFTTFLCTCDRAPQRTEPTVVVGTLRYQANNNVLEATLQMTPVDTSAAAVFPTLFGTAVQPLALAGTGNFRARRKVAWPGKVNLTVPCADGPNCPLTVDFAAPFADSIPARISKEKSLQFAVADRGMTEDESLIFFFEPADRSRPRRLQLIGPTDTGVLTVRKEALAAIPTGEYQVYLVKQQLAKDSTAKVVSSFQIEYFTASRALEVVD